MVVVAFSRSGRHCGGPRIISVETYSEIPIVVLDRNPSVAVLRGAGVLYSWERQMLRSAQASLPDEDWELLEKHCRRLHGINVAGDSGAWLGELHGRHMDDAADKTHALGAASQYDEGLSGNVAQAQAQS